MGYILLIMLEPSSSNITFLDIKSIKLSSMKYNGENVLVIESTVETICRIMFNFSDLIDNNVILMNVKII